MLCITWRCNRQHAQSAICVTLSALHKSPLVHVAAELVVRPLSTRNFHHLQNPKFMEFLEPDSFKKLSNPGVQSTQLLSPENSNSNRVTITSVTVQPGAEQPRHAHSTSEQIWITVDELGTLLLKDETTLAFNQGQVVRFEDGDIHGFKNTSDTPFTYISITSPPINFAFAYKSNT